MSVADPTGPPERDVPPAARAAGGRGPGHDTAPGALLAVGLGGLLGTVARYEVGLAWPAAAGGFPTATFTVNTTGAFLLGLTLSLILGRGGHRRYLRPFVATGLLGGWTTYSALAVESTTLATGGHLATAAAYLGATLAAGLATLAAGIALGRRGGVVAAAPIDPDLPEGAEVTG